MVEFQVTSQKHNLKIVFIFCVIHHKLNKKTTIQKKEMNKKFANKKKPTFTIINDVSLVLNLPQNSRPFRPFHLPSKTRQESQQQ